MLNNWSDKKVAWIVFIIWVVCLTLLLIIGPLPDADATSKTGRTYRDTPTCTSPDKTDADCGNVRLYRTGWVRQEAEDLRRYTDAEYLGWSSRDLGNFDHGYASVQTWNGRGEVRYHLYYFG